MIGQNGPLFLQPDQRGMGPTDQKLGQVRVGQSTGYPHKVGIEIILGVPAYIHRRLFFWRHVGHEGFDPVFPIWLKQVMRYIGNFLAFLVVT